MLILLNLLVTDNLKSDTIIQTAN